MRARLPYKMLVGKLELNPSKETNKGATFALSFNWPLKKTMDQESMTAFGFLYIIHFFSKNPNLSSLALSDTFMGKNIRFVPCLPYV